ncbi:MAG: hypothetical protein MK105_18380 [Crocinitomicaceae bacterium]|nr:hypothetical protein [Crocinitomicaceae bacterium]
MDGTSKEGCGQPTGYGQLHDNNQTLVIDYEINDPNDPSLRIQRRFIGSRVE